MNIPIYLPTRTITYQYTVVPHWPYFAANTVCVADTSLIEAKKKIEERICPDCRITYFHFQVNGLKLCNYDGMNLLWKFQWTLKTQLSSHEWYQRGFLQWYDVNLYIT